MIGYKKVKREKMKEQEGWLSAFLLRRRLKVPKEVSRNESTGFEILISTTQLRGTNQTNIH